MGFKKFVEEKRKWKWDEYGENVKRVKDFFVDRGVDDIDWEKGYSEKGFVRFSFGNKDFKFRFWYYRFVLVEIFFYMGGVNEEIREK